MKRNSTALGLVVQAALKFDPGRAEWGNLIAFIQSCYACRVREYDLEDACAALSRLTDEEQHALIAWVLFVEDGHAEPDQE